MNKRIEGEREKKFLLDSMINFQPALGLSTVECAQALTELLIEMPVAWFTVKEQLKEEFADLWVEKYGEWKHGSGNAKKHNKLGMAYAWWALHKVEGLSDIELSDSPDFSGSMPLVLGKHKSSAKANVWGDIGKCTPTAIFNGLMVLNIHDIWISVIDWETQIFLQFGYSPARYRHLKLWAGISKPADYSKATREIFFCEECDEWSITDDTRKTLIERFQSFRSNKQD